MFPNSDNILKQILCRGLPCDTSNCLWLPKNLLDDDDDDDDEEKEEEGEEEIKRKKKKNM